MQDDAGVGADGAAGGRWKNCSSSELPVALFREGKKRSGRRAGLGWVPRWPPLLRSLVSFVLSEAARLSQLKVGADLGRVEDRLDNEDGPCMDSGAFLHGTAWSRRR
jgi:hypothetical protein